MERILVAGATGAVGRATCAALKRRGYTVRGMATSDESAGALGDLVDESAVADATDSASLGPALEDVDAVVSSIGKPVSLFADDDNSYDEIDHRANGNLLEEAQRKGIGRFVYVSIYGSDLYGDFEVARAHRAFERMLEESGLSYTIVRPVGMFSGLEDLLRMARQGAVITIGEGDHRTNPIHHEDLAEFIAENVADGPEIVNIGGPETLTRHEIGELACRATGCELHLTVPEIATAGVLPGIAFLDKNVFDKLAFFERVLTTDVVAPPFGSRRLEDYFRERAEMKLR